MAHKNRTRAELNGLGLEARVAVPGPTGKKNTDVGGELSQLHHPEFDPGTRQSCRRPYSLGHYIVGSKLANDAFVCACVACVVSVLLLEYVWHVHSFVP